MPSRRFVCLGFGAALCGCRGTATPVPTTSADAIALAAAEIGDQPPPLRRQLAEGEVTATLRRVSRRIEPPAWEVCRDLDLNGSEWFVGASRSRQMDAHAAADGRVVINRGIIEYARSDDEVAFVLAHELAHHAADHLGSGRAPADAGAALGALIGGALVVAGALGGLRASAARNARTVEDWSGSGARLGRIAFSKDQEREADRLGLMILVRAGYDPSAARRFVITMGRASRRREAGLFDTHPAGPERLAAFDATWSELQLRGGRLPLS